MEFQIEDFLLILGHISGVKKHPVQINLGATNVCTIYCSLNGKDIMAYNKDLSLCLADAVVQYKKQFPDFTINH